eukprot:CAMPEP_0183337582 /NCGR_PEP_ID=MMETSP0164_2-20130417/5169_1 /TAXON_ID=221442 /ORGANISM="Coccolithus pelagicus ssp braarudi, Strain PLY182g" /LENGTH=254 /DNA_ID=CAMNT_0025507289 /DNA_START=1 /DNA_END=766 /DNA_ORIENTATION=-
MNGGAHRFRQKYVSDQQAREISRVFELLDVRSENVLSMPLATHLCRQLGFNVEHRSVSHAESGISLLQILSWCESFLEACATSDDLKLTQKFILLQRGEAGVHVPRRMLEKNLASDRTAVSSSALDAFCTHLSELDEVGSRPHAVSEQAFKRFVRQQRKVAMSHEDFDGTLPPITEKRKLCLIMQSGGSLLQDSCTHLSVSRSVRVGRRPRGGVQTTCVSASLSEQVVQAMCSARGEENLRWTDHKEVSMTLES